MNRRLLLALACVLLAAAGAAGCGGSSQTDIGPYLGTWQRVEGGAPDPDFTLTIARQHDAAAVTFANQTNGMSETVTAAAEDGHLACTLSTGDAGLPSADDGSVGAPVGASPGAAIPVTGPPTRSDLQLSLDENGQLVVDVVLADGTLEPVWIYERSPSGAPSSVDPGP